MIENGYIKIYRSLLSWEWYDDINTKILFLHLLLTVNYEDKKWHGITIKRGQRACSISRLSEETRLSIKNVRTALEHLKSTNEVASDKNLKCGLLTVINYDKYQTVASETANEGQDGGKRGASEGQQCKKDKNNKKDKNITPLPPLNGFSALVQKAITDWMEYKHQRGDKYQPKSVETLLKKIKGASALYGEDAVIAEIESSISAGYQGIVWDRLKNGGEKHEENRPSRGTVL